MAEYDKKYPKYKCPTCGKIDHPMVDDMTYHANIFCTACNNQLNNVKPIENVYRIGNLLTYYKGELKQIKELTDAKTVLVQIEDGRYKAIPINKIIG